MCFFSPPSFIACVSQSAWHHQNYFSDAWNVFDFIIVLGSFVDILYSEISVSFSILVTEGLYNGFFLTNFRHFVIICYNVFEILFDYSREGT